MVNKVVCFCFSSFEAEASLFFVNIEHDDVKDDYLDDEKDDYPDEERDNYLDDERDNYPPTFPTHSTSHSLHHPTPLPSSFLHLAAA